eukprot:284818301_6
MVRELVLSGGFPKPLYQFVADSQHQTLQEYLHKVNTSLQNRKPPVEAAAGLSKFPQAINNEHAKAEAPDVVKNLGDTVSFPVGACSPSPTGGSPASSVQRDFAQSSLSPEPSRQVKRGNIDTYEIATADAPASMSRRALRKLLLDTLRQLLERREREQAELDAEMEEEPQNGETALEEGEIFLPPTADAATAAPQKSKLIYQGIDLETIDDDAPLYQLGFDSVTAVEFADLLSQNLAIPLPPTLVFQHPTLDELIAHLQYLLKGGHSNHLVSSQSEEAMDSIRHLNQKPSLEGGFGREGDDRPYHVNNL